jgi:hypothetical protein
MKMSLGEEFCIIASPFEPSELVVDGNALTVFSFDMQQINVEELIGMIRKHQ